MNTFQERAHEVADGDLGSMRGLLLLNSLRAEAATTDHGSRLVVFSSIKENGPKHAVGIAFPGEAVIAGNADQFVINSITDYLAQAGGEHPSDVEALCFMSASSLGQRVLGVVFGDSSWTVMSVLTDEEGRKSITSAVSSHEVQGIMDGHLISPEHPLSRSQSLVISRLDDISRAVSSKVVAMRG